MPYDEKRFAGVPRNGYSLVVSPSTRSVGGLLDLWSNVQFHQPSSTLYLGVYRPVSTVYKREGDVRCDVEQRWIAVELNGVPNGV